MKKVSIVNIKNNQTFQNISENPTEWINDCISNNYWGKSERWVRAKELLENGNPEESEHWMWHSEPYEPSDILQTEERIDEITGESTSWVLLKAEYAIEIEDITEQLNKENRIIELKKLLSESDFRMTTDYYKRMTPEKQTYWDDIRESWRSELRSLGV